MAALLSSEKIISKQMFISLLATAPTQLIPK
jgi:hypothetical protein